MGDVETPALVKQIVRGLRGSAFLATVLATSFMAASHEKAIFPFDYKADYTDLMLFNGDGSRVSAQEWRFSGIVATNLQPSAHLLLPCDFSNLHGVRWSLHVPADHHFFHLRYLKPSYSRLADSSSS
ncbi:hypothetical protein OIU79_001935 [Salix purpurea]|uniref:Uncharacterized protein n=1 Tax=Salix purpurea TaxID=77065 RepID=A0A9Q0UR26_SALPP|nr:hypothetical protein OIU79_001935 [Salix purpurea]